MKKISLTLLLFSILFLACQQQDTGKRLVEIDSLVVCEHYDSAFTLLAEIDTMKLVDMDQKAHYCLLRTQLGYLTQQPDSSNMLDIVALPYYEATHNEEKLSECYYYKGYGMVLTQNMDSATLCYKKAENLSVNTNNSRLEFKIVQSLSAINGMCGNSQIQIEYAHKMERIAKEADNKKWLAFAYHNLGYAFSQIDQSDSVLFYINKVEPLISYVPQNDLAAFLTNVAYIYKHNQPEKAKEYLQKVLSEQEDSYALEHLADIYYAEGKQEEAYRLWKRALVISDSNPKDNILHNILEYDVEHGNTDDVCEKVNEIIQIKDSLFNKLKNDTIKEMQLRFDHEVALNRQERVTNNWQKALFVAAIIALLLIIYIIIRNYREHLKMKDVQMQINDYQMQIEELKHSGEDASAAIEELNKQIKEYLDNESPKLKQGRIRYDEIMDGKTISGWNKRDEEDFNNYYEAINFRTVRRLKKAKRKNKLNPHHLFYLILVEMGKEDKEIARILGINERSVDTLKTRTKPI